jgi:large subunit ribosomal protein L21
MYAVIETGGKQYRVELGTELEVELLDAAPGDEITLDRVLLVADGETASIGRPVVADGGVTARVIRRDRGEKVISFKYRPKARSRVTKGHRQELTVLRITDVRLGDRSAAELARLAAEAAAVERERITEAASRQAAEDAAIAARLAASRSAEKADSTTTAATPKRGRTSTKAAAPATDAPAPKRGRAPSSATSSPDVTAASGDASPDHGGSTDAPDKPAPRPAVDTEKEG